MAWMIYGANGYTGALIARAAAAHGLTPVLAGRGTAVEALGAQLRLQTRRFGVDQAAEGLAGMSLVLNCAGPFSHTAAPMIAAAIGHKAHYLDITGEIAVFEAAYAQDWAARAAGVLVCPGVGFDVVPTDCVAATLKAALPDATHLALGFHGAADMSAGTAKSALEGMAQGGKIRRDGKIETVPLGYRRRRIDYGRGERLSMTLPWGDIASAWRTTGIPNIEVYIPAPPTVAYGARLIDPFRGVLGLPAVRNWLGQRIERTVKGPDEARRAARPSYVWGEVRNAAGQTRTMRIRTPNGYTLTIESALAAVARMLGTRAQPGGGNGAEPGGSNGAEPGASTPALSFGADFVRGLPGVSVPQEPA